MASTISIAVLAETAKARQELEKVNGSLGHLKKSADSGKGVLKGVLGGNLITKGIDLAGQGLSKFTDLLGDSVSEARESQKVGATTAQIIKSTGGAAKVSADQVGDLAQAISNKSGVDDEAIQKGSNLLLTFKNVRNEAGKGADIFNQATQAAVDLSAAGFGSIEGSSKMLGKALNDPIKGISALGRAGVTFTDQQKAQIKTLVQSGDVLGAQKIIMGEVQSQVGGVAAASATAGEKFKVMGDNLKEQFGTILLPYLDKFLNFFTTTIGPAISKGLSLLGPALTKVGSLIGPIIDKLTGAFSGKGDGGGIGAYAASIIAAVQKLGPIVLQVFGAIVGAVKENLPAIKQFYQSAAEIISGVASIIVKVWKVVGPVVLPIVKSIFSTIINVIGGALKIVSGVVKVFSSLLQGDWKGAWEGVKRIVSGVLQIVKALIKNAMTQAKTIMSATLGQMVSIVKSKIADLVGKVRALPGQIKGIFSNAGSFLRDAGAKIINGLIDGIQAGFARVRSLLNDLTDQLPDWKGPADKDAKILVNAGRLIMQGLVNGLDYGETGVMKQLQGTTKRIAGAFQGATITTPQIASGGFSGASTGATVININVTAGVGDPVAIGKEIDKSLTAFYRVGRRAA